MNDQNVNQSKENKEPEERKAYYEERPEFGKKGPSKLRQHFNRGMTSFLVVAASIVFYFLLLRVTNLSESISKITDVLRPVVYGCIIAYLLNPIVKQVDKLLVPVLSKSLKNETKARKIARAAGIFVSIIILFMIIGALFNLLIPELYSSIRNLIFTLPQQISDVLEKLNEIQFEDSTVSVLLKQVVEEGSDMFMKWLRTDLLNMTNEIMGNLTEGVITFISEVFNILIGLIVSIYILFSKELFGQQSKKAVYAILNTDHANMVLHLVTKSNEIFGGFIIGKLIDSAIIGVLCFFGLSILNIPYAMLVSVVVGVTNVIPFFGPYIGAIPSAVLIMLADPMKGIYFILFILILQQFDGNILGPKILGNSTGLSAFWVIVAILLGGGLFGFVGMIMGVPTFAVIFYIVQMLINHQLEKKKLPVESKYYDEYSYVDSTGTYVHAEESAENKKGKEE